MLQLMLCSAQLCLHDIIFCMQLIKLQNAQVMLLCRRPICVAPVFLIALCAVTGNVQASSPSAASMHADKGAQAAAKANIPPDDMEEMSPDPTPGDEHHRASPSRHNINVGSEAGPEGQLPQHGTVEAPAQAHNHDAIQSSEVAFAAKSVVLHRIDLHGLKAQLNTSISAQILHDVMDKEHVKWHHEHK